MLVLTDLRLRILGIKRALANLIERSINARIVRPMELGLLFEQEHLRRFFDHFKIDCVFDVGANTGQYAAMLRNHASYSGPIISFEPNPDVSAVLKSKAQRDPCWFVEEIAVGSSTEQAKFNITVEDQLASLHKPQTTDMEVFSAAATISRVIDVKVSTLEIELYKYRQKLRFKRPFLKMDTQGHDIDVARGAGTMLREFVGLQSELAIKRIYENAPSYDEALRFYADSGFILSAFVPNNAFFFPYLIEMDCIMFNKNYLD